MYTISKYQIVEFMEDTQRESDMIDDGIDLGPVEYFNMIERMMYNRRYVTGMRFMNTFVIFFYF